MIEFLQQENKKLKVNQLLLSKLNAYLLEDDDKGKAVIDVTSVRTKMFR